MINKYKCNAENDVSNYMNLCIISVHILYKLVYLLLKIRWHTDQKKNLIRVVEVL